MLLNENPCKGCENNHEEIIFKWYGCVGIHTSSLTCPDYVAYQAQRELLGKVVEDLRERAEKAESSINEGKKTKAVREYLQYKAIIINDIASTYEKELQG